MVPLGGEKKNRTKIQGYKQWLWDPKQAENFHLYCGSCAGSAQSWWGKKADRPPVSSLIVLPWGLSHSLTRVSARGLGVIAQSDQKEVARSQPNDYCPEIDLGYLFKQKSWSNNIGNFFLMVGPQRLMEAIVKLPKTLICGKMVRSGGKDIRNFFTRWTCKLKFRST